MTNPPAADAITEDEAELYDRQIRLWGLDAQNRLRAARILVAGMSGLGCEVAKNLVLAGVKSLTMLDHRTVAQMDQCAAFFIDREKLGSNRAESCVDRCQQLNPLVNVTADAANLDDKPEEFFRDFDVVLVTNASKDTLIKVNGFCRTANAKFFAGDIIGFFGFSFMDLISHEYAEEVTVKSSTAASSSDSAAPAAKKAKVDGEPAAAAAAAAETKTVKSTATFVPLQQALNVNWNSEANAKKIKRMDPAFFLLEVLLEFRSREGCYPRPELRAPHAQKLAEIRDEVAFKYKLPEGKIPDQLLELLYAELSPVSAIVGGMCGQEIIKCISNKDAPHNNFFLYNPLPGAGIVETVGY